jgi:hypothetical protein
MIHVCAYFKGILKLLLCNLRYNICLRWLLLDVVLRITIVCV